MQYYEAKPEQEQARLDKFCRVEFEITRRAILANLPASAGLRILDIGGAAGKYSFWLRSLGHEVTLIDLSPSLIELAKQQYDPHHGVPPMEIAVGNAVDLSMLRGGSFDAILSLGPQYHLIDHDDIAQSLSELKRLIKPGGVIFCAFLNKLGTLRWFWNNRPQDFYKHIEVFRSFETNGHFPEVDFAGFNDYRAYSPEEVIALMEGAGFETKSLLNCEGLGGRTGLADLSEDAFAALMNYAFERADDLGMSTLAEHLLWIGKLQP
jgi:SAM-dependent methyltransferase